MSDISSQRPDRTPQRELQTFNYAAARLGVGKKKIDELIEAGELPVIDLSVPGADRKQLRIKISDLEAFIERRRVLPLDSDSYIRRRTTRRNPKVKTFFE